MSKKLTVVCVNPGSWTSLTKGKEYEVIEVGNSTDYKIRDNSGNIHSYLQSRFKPVDEPVDLDKLIEAANAGADAHDKMVEMGVLASIGSNDSEFSVIRFSVGFAKMYRYRRKPKPLVWEGNNILIENEKITIGDIVFADRAQLITGLDLLIHSEQNAYALRLQPGNALLLATRKGVRLLECYHTWETVERLYEMIKDLK